jgi:hypothetical protein
MTVRQGSFRVHLCVDIAGLLRNEGRKMTLRERKGYELDLARGRRVLPLCDPSECPGFSYKTGCPGHPDDAPSASPASAREMGEGSP